MTWTPPVFTPGVPWKDAPSVTTPLDAVNLNLEESAEAAYAASVGTSLAGYVDGKTVLSVKDPAFGAKGDGTTDDTVAIQAALDSAVGLATGGHGGGVVFFPKTSAGYRITAALITYPHIRLMGEASRVDTSVASFLKADATGNFTNGNFAGVFMLKDVNATGNVWHGGSIEHLGFDCNNTPGLGAVHLWSPGEHSLLEFVHVLNAGVTARTVNDAVTNTTTTVTSATAAFTADDVNAVVTSSGADIPANTKISIVNSATSVTLNNAATGSHAAQNLTINRPADGIVFDGAAPTGIARSVNGSNLPGALLRLKNFASGSWVIESLSGDANAGGLLRISLGSAGADPASVTLLNMKSENATTWNRQDPVVLMDNCDMVSLNVVGGSFLTGFASTDIVRIDQPVTARGGPSVSLTGLEGTNPFNFGYTNIIRDTSTGQAIAANPNNVHLYPDVLWGRSLIMGGGNAGASIITPRAALAQAGTVTPDAQAGEWQTLTVTTNAAITIAAPSNPPNANQKAELTIEVLNSSGGAMGVITWDAAYVFAAGAWVNPASTKKRSITFKWNGAKWVGGPPATTDY